MSYYGDCRDVHYTPDPKNNQKCEKLVHDTNLCVMGHVKCIGRVECVRRSHKTGGQYGNCTFFW